MFAAKKSLGVFRQVNPFPVFAFTKVFNPSPLFEVDVVFLHTFTTSYEHAVAHNSHSCKFGDICHIINSVRTNPYTTVPVMGFN